MSIRQDASVACANHHMASAAIDRSHTHREHRVLEANLGLSSMFRVKVLVVSGQFSAPKENLRFLLFFNILVRLCDEIGANEGHLAPARNNPSSVIVNI